jgi:hypothetical protein
MITYGCDLNGDNKIDLMASRKNFTDGAVANNTFFMLNETPTIPETVKNGVYRFFNTQTGTHFYDVLCIHSDIL